MIFPQSGILYSLKEEGSSYIFYNVDEPWGHHAYEISQAQKHKCCMTTYMKHLEWSDSEMEGGVAIAWAGGEAVGSCSVGPEFQLYKMRKF